VGTRYDNRFILTNDLEEYSKVLEQRGVKLIKYYSTGLLRYPTVKEIQQLKQIQHIWTTGDRYYKLASEYYGDPTLWWVIAHYNQKPTEGSLELGDVIYIPLPIGQVLGYMMNRNNI